jgi:prepilin-type N-terminal cleavage/methylation domain-containing protein
LIQNTKHKILNTKKGFTLIETLVVVFVVGIGLIGALSFFSINISNQSEMKNELIATGLAQEGADLVRNKVDYEKLIGTNWSAIVAALAGSNCTRIDRNSLTGAHPCNNGGNNYLCFADGRYQQCASGIGTGMQRTLSIQHKNDSNGDRLEVQCEVKWNDRTTTTKDVLYATQF